MRFPHSDIVGSKVVRHLTDAYRSLTTPFIATVSLGILRMLLVEFPWKIYKPHLYVVYFFAILHSNIHRAESRVNFDSLILGYLVVNELVVRKKKTAFLAAQGQATKRHASAADVV
jgi:hypothetical protein